MKLKNYQKYQTPRVGQTPLELEYGVLAPGSFGPDSMVDESENVNYLEDGETSEPLNFEF